MISVSRKTHIPKVEASFCCSMSSKWWTSAGWCSVDVVGLVSNGDHLDAVGIGFSGDDRRVMEVVGWWRRTGFPFQPRGLPRIVAGHFAVLQRPYEVDRRQNESHGEYRSSGARKHVQHLKFQRVSGVAARHAEIAQNELREKRKI